MAFSLPNIVIKPYLVTLFHAPLCSYALRLRNTRVPVWTHESIGYTKMDIRYWDVTTHYCIQLAQYCDRTRYFKDYLRRSPPVYSLALILKKTKKLVWTHGSMGCPKMHISNWVAAVHYGIQLATYILTKPYLVTIFHGNRPSLFPCPKTQEHQSTCVDS